MNLVDIFANELNKIAKVGGGVHQHFTEKTIHDPGKRPAKVKEIYRAIKREHPEYPAEFKARIALRKGSKSKAERKEGPPYEGPLAGK
jgi:hypothetical protein